MHVYILMHNFINIYFMRIYMEHSEMNFCLFHTCICKSWPCSAVMWNNT